MNRIAKGLAALDENDIPMELHHPYGRNGEDFFKFSVVTRKEHHDIHYGKR